MINKPKYSNQIKGRVFKIESLNTHNGPGYRTVIYMKGCPLNCLWCHNPEGISAKKEIWVIHNKCIACLSCVNACPNSALSFINNKIELDRNACEGCYSCADVCPSKAIEKLGIDYTVSEIFERLTKDKPFMEASGGGVTVTGGEPGIYPEFVSALFKKCRESGIHTAFDTSGFISKKALEMIVPVTDLVFFDLKIINETSAKELTGQGKFKIIEALDWIKSYIISNNRPELQIRTPIIPGATNDENNLREIAKLLEKEYQGFFTEWELNLFNDICEDKYLRMDKKWHFNSLKINKKDYSDIEKYANKNTDMKVKISGYYHK